jgi:hypothetical protein
MAAARWKLVAGAGVDEPVVDDVAAIFLGGKVWEHLPACRVAWATVEAALAPGLTLAEAHRNWLPAAFAERGTLPPLFAQDLDAVTPAGLVRVAVECRVALSGGMSSYYGFEGHFVSLLVHLPLRYVWDARRERAG